MPWFAGLKRLRPFWLGLLCRRHRKRGTSWKGSAIRPFYSVTLLALISLSLLTGCVSNGNGCPIVPVVLSDPEMDALSPAALRAIYHNNEIYFER